MKKKLVRITTVPISLKVLLRQQLRFMAAYFDVLAVSSPGKILDEVSINEGVRTASVAMTRSVTPVKDLTALWRLYRLFKKEQPAIVHTHTPKAGLLGMIAARMAGVPVRLHTVAGLPLMERTGIRKKVLEFTERLTYSCATKIYPNSANLASFLLKKGFCKAGKIKVLGNGSSNGIDTAFFQLSESLLQSADELKEELQLQQDDFVFVFIGRLVKDKGIEELVEAFITLKERYSHIKLLLVGPYEPLLDPIASQIKEAIETDSHIIRVDFQHDIRPYLALSHVLVFPSYREGFPNVPMQAGCFHLPAIVTDINGCNEIIEHKRNGLIIPAKNEEALLDAMEMVMTNEPLYLDLKKNARQLILDRYEQKYFWGLLLREYDDQLKEHAFLS
jgi:glycosyltransferase involved in cell wall biosynthesis